MTAGERRFSVRGYWLFGFTSIGRERWKSNQEEQTRTAMRLQFATVILFAQTYVCKTIVTGMTTVGLLHRGRMETLAHNVAVQIKALRERRSWSQEELAEAAGLSRDAISRIERGDREPKLATLEAIANAVGLELAQLLASDKKPSRSFRRKRDTRVQSIAKTLSSVEPWLADALTSAVRLIGKAQARARKKK